jgi:hypothetical protein
MVPSVNRRVLSGVAAVCCGVASPFLLANGTAIDGSRLMYGSVLLAGVSALLPLVCVPQRSWKTALSFTSVTVGSCVVFWLSAFALLSA